VAVSDWDAEAVAQARLVGFLLFGGFKLIGLCVRALWWLAMRHAWVLLALAVLAENAGLLPSPLTDERVHALFSVLFVWAALGLAWPPAHRAFKAHRARRLARTIGGQMERPGVQAAMVRHMPGGDRMKATTGEALAVWGRWNRVTRQLRRDWNDVHGGRLPKAMRQQWEQMVKTQMEAS
jgi:hypothetical protein